MHSSAEERRKAVVFAVEIVEWLCPLALGLVLLMVVAALVV